MGFLSFLVIAGATTGILYLIFNALPNLFISLRDTIASLGDVPAFLNDPKILMIVSAFIIGVIFWSIVHSVLIRPFVLVGVLRNYMAAGIKNMPTEADIKERMEMQRRNFEAMQRKKAEEKNDQ